MATCLIALGSNLGDGATLLQAAYAALAQALHFTPLRCSRIHSTTPAGGPLGQSQFSNAAAALETSLTPPEVLRRLHEVEQRFGRVRTERWGPRSLDLDLLLYDDLQLHTPELTLPHPRMSFRRFVLAPAAEMAADFVYPVNGWTIAQLLSHLDQAPDWIEFAETSSFDAPSTLTEIARRVADIHQWRIGREWLADAQAMPKSWLPRPKLVVVVDPPGGPSCAAADRRQRLHSATHQPLCGPSLWLPTSDPHLVADEVVAAIEAMR